jgi:hypothetical protein
MKLIGKAPPRSRRFASADPHVETAQSASNLRDASQGSNFCPLQINGRDRVLGKVARD